MRRILPFLPLMFFMLAVGLLTLKLTQPPAPQANNARLVSGMQMPDFSLPLLEGDGTFSPRLWNNRIALINVFASWCVPCAAEMPLLQKMAERHGASIYGIAWHDKPERTKEFLSKYGNPYAAVGLDPQGTLTASLGLLGIPETYVVGRDGKVLFKYGGALDETIIMRSILPLLNGSRDAL